MSATVLSRLGTQFNDWIARRDTEDPAWRGASVVASGQVWMRQDELREFGARVEKLIEIHRDRSAADHPDDARHVRYALFAFPSDSPPQ